MKRELLIIITARNEEENIAAVLDGLKDIGADEFADVLVIDDASSDRTGEIARGRGCKLLRNPFNLGYGSSIQLGYRYAVKEGYRFVIQMDADGQHDACNIPGIYGELRGEDAGGKLPDIVLASRFMEGSSDFPVSFAKGFAIRLFRGIIRAVTGRRLADPTTGLQGLSAGAFRYYAGYGHFDEKYPDSNMVIQMLRLGFRIREIPAVMHARTAGSDMHSGLKPVGYMFKMLYSIPVVLFRTRRGRAERPSAGRTPGEGGEL